MESGMVELKRTLTQAQMEVLTAIMAFEAERGRSPSRGEIGASIGKSRGAVRSLLKRLEQAGHVTRAKGCSEVQITARCHSILRGAY